MIRSQIFKAILHLSLLPYTSQQPTAAQQFHRSQHLHKLGTRNCNGFHLESDLLGDGKKRCSPQKKPRGLQDLQHQWSNNILVKCWQLPAFDRLLMCLVELFRHIWHVLGSKLCIALSCQNHLTYKTAVTKGAKSGSKSNIRSYSKNCKTTVVATKLSESKFRSRDDFDVKDLHFPNLQGLDPNLQVWNVEFLEKMSSALSRPYPLEVRENKKRLQVACVFMGSWREELLNLFLVSLSHVIIVLAQITYALAFWIVCLKELR